ncbi:hypothetical protein ACWD0Z_06010 [Streptomyces sp. NPDC003007]
MSHQLKTIPALDTTPKGRVPFLVDEPREHPADGTETLAALARECEQRGIALTEDPTLTLAVLVDVDGRPTLITPPDGFDETLDELRGIGRCIGCRNEVDDTATPYYPGYDHLDGTPILICPVCRDEQTARANEPGRLAFSRCMDAIEAVFKASKNPEMTRQALREFVDLTANGARA